MRTTAKTGTQSHEQSESVRRPYEAPRIMRRVPVAANTLQASGTQSFFPPEDPPSP